VPVEAFASSDSVRLHYLDWGGTGKPLVLLAGLGGTAQHYRGLAPRLAKRFRVVGLTRRGHGRSDRPDSGYDLDTLVEDIRRFLDALVVEKANLVGHSFAGFEMPRLAVRYPQRVESIVYLDALFPRLDPEPDLSGDPVAPLLPTGPTPDDLASRDAYLAYYKRARPDWARIWCEAIEANVMDYVTIDDGGHMVFHHDDELMNRILEDLWPRRDPEYEKVAVPMLAIVPDGNTHQSLPLDATDELRLAADRYWATKILPWIRQRTAVFRQAAPTARVVELDTPSHHVFIAREDETVAAIGNFLEG
jgi:pimeloyl-ACP methyl ester carboxylesterase